MLLNPYRFATATGGLTTLKTGLLNWWDLEEVSGTRAPASGGLNLTESGTVGRASMRSGYGSSATSSSYLKNSASPDLSAGGFTIAGVFRTSQANAGLVSRQNATGAAVYRQFLVTLEGGVCYLAVSVDGANNAAVVGAGSGLNDGNLHDFIVWRDVSAGTLCAQIDGGTVVSVAFSGASSLFNAFDPGLFLHAIGSATYANGSDLDSVGIWGRTLTSTERGVLRNGGAWRSYADL